MKGNRLDIYTYPTTGTATISVSNGYGTLITAPIKGIVRSIVIVPPRKTNSAIIGATSINLDIDYST